MPGPKVVAGILDYQPQGEVNANEKDEWGGEWPPFVPGVGRRRRLGDGSSDLPQAVGSDRGRRGARRFGHLRHGQESRRARRIGRRPADRQVGLHALLGGLHGHGRGPRRCLDRPGAGLGQPLQPGRPLRQGRCGARDGARRTAPQASGQAGRRQMAEDRLGDRGQRDRRQDARDPRAVGTGFGLLAGLGQAQQRAGLSLPQVLRLLGHQQR